MISAAAGARKISLIAVCEPAESGAAAGSMQRYRKDGRAAGSEPPASGGRQRILSGSLMIAGRRTREKLNDVKGVGKPPRGPLALLWIL